MSQATSAHDPLRTEHLRADLRRRSVRGGAITLGAQLIKFFLQMAATVFLARLLSPRDYGLIGMVVVVTGFISIFKDLGLSQASIHREELTQDQVSTLFWINVGAGVALALIVAALGPAVAWFYNEPRLTAIMMWLACSFVLAGVSAQHSALLRRQMRHGILGTIDVVSMAAGLTSAFVAAMLGARYWALVIQSITTTATSAGLAIALSGWRPGWARRGAGVRSMVAFGGNLSASQALHYVTRNADNLLIGWFWGAAPLGLYTKGFQIVLLPMQQLINPFSNVVVPALSRLKDDPERYRRYYRKAVLPLVAASMPLVVFCTVEAENIVRLMLGERWMGVATIFQLLGPASFVGASYVATGWVYLSTGQARRQLRWGMFASPVMVTAFVCGLPWGPAGVAAAYSIATVLLRYPSVVYCFRNTPVTARDMLAVTWRPTVASLAAGALVWLTHGTWATAVPALSLCLSGALYLGAYAAIWLALPDGLRTASEFRGMLAELLTFRRKAAAAEQPACA